MLERSLVETRTSISWRITAPLRLFGLRRRPAEARPRLGPDVTAPRAQTR
jgi:hypothetical protein